MKKIIITEGREDARFFKGFLDAIKIKEVEVYPISERGNKEQIFDINKLQTKLNSSGIGEVSAKILIVCDADYEVQKSRFNGFVKTKSTADQLLQDLLKNSDNSNKEIGFFIIPNNGEDGNLDSLFLSSTTYKKEELECVDSYLNCLKQSSFEKTSKVKSRILLAALGAKDEIFQIGYAAFDDESRKHRIGYWDFGSVALQPLAKFLKNYFN